MYFEPWKDTEREKTQVENVSHSQEDDVNLKYINFGFSISIFLKNIQKHVICCMCDDATHIQF